MSKIIVPLRTEERDALVELAMVELRDPPDQARFILRRELSAGAYCLLLQSLSRRSTTMTRIRTDPPPMTEAEVRRRLGDAYRILLDLAAKRREREAAQTTDTMKSSADHADESAA